MDDTNTQNTALIKNCFELDFGTGKLVAIAPINDPNPKIKNRPELGLKFKVAFFSRPGEQKPVMQPISEADFLKQE